MPIAFARRWFALGLVLAAARAQDLPQVLDALCQPVVDAEIAMGFVVGVVDGEATVVRGYGRLAEGRDRVPDEHTVYEIGSISKVFTGLLFADAVERGAVGLDDPLQKYLPESVVLPVVGGEPVRLRHLTTHTSGLPRLPPGPPGDPDDPYAHLTRERLHEALEATTLRRRPGSQYDYSNFAVGTLGDVLVRVAGSGSYADLLRERIAAPLHLVDTCIQLDARLRERLAPPYDGGLEPAHNWDLAALAGAGGIRSTMADMLVFARAQFGGGDAPLAAAIARSHQQLHADAKGVAVAYGWHIAKDGITLWHNGQTGGYHSYLGVEPSLRRAVCVLANTPASEIDVVGERVLQYLFARDHRPGSAPVVAPIEIERPVAVDRAVLARYVGTYRGADGSEFVLELRPRGLYARLADQPMIRLFARSPTEFFYRVVEASITFDVDGAAVRALVLHQNGHDLRFDRKGAGPVK